jgi:hypothetical protein
VDNSPVFIHSLFRPGSTYFFNVFRRSPAGYFCFQEALHPVVFFLKDRPQDLLKFHTSTYELMRHPNLDKPVFYEVASVSSAWKEKITYSAIFDGYFGSDQADTGVEFFRAILDEVKDGRPVFEECRTAGRIGLLKEKLKGVHIYLWRNPWDQWWSYKTIDHLDYQNREIINAPNTLNAITKLRSQLSFQEAYTDAVLQVQDGVLTAEESYLTYYLLWCLGLHEGIKHAHLLINIDKLTESEMYREQILASLAENGVHGIDFSDCQSPQGDYFNEDMNFFSPLEDRVHEWLIEDLSIEELNHIQELRRQYQPKNLSTEVKDEQLKNFARQVTQIRAVSRRFETSKTFYLQKYLKLSNEYETRILKLSEEYETRILKLGDEYKTRIEHVKQEKNKALELLNAVYNSRFWRLTQPLRWVGHQVQLLRLHELKGRIVELAKKIRNN